jgi:hypothetical protein
MKTTMTTHLNPRGFIACLAVVLGLLSPHAAAIDPGTVKGTLTYKGKVYNLQNAYAWQPPGQNEALLVVIADAKLPPAAVKGGSAVARLAAQNNFRALQFTVHATKPDLNTLDATLYAPEDYHPRQSSGGPQWQQLAVNGRRVTGRLKADGDTWSVNAEFSAPVFGGTGKSQTLTGAQAQTSPQADAFLAFEKALLTEGIDPAGPHMTPERLASYKEMLKKSGEAAFKDFQARRLKTTPVGDPRRKQIERLIVDGDYAFLIVQDGPKDTDRIPLAKIGSGWKVDQ